MDGWILTHLRLFTYKRSYKFPTYGMKSTNLRKKDSPWNVLWITSMGLISIEVLYNNVSNSFLPCLSVNKREDPSNSVLSRTTSRWEVPENVHPPQWKSFPPFCPNDDKKNGWTGKRIETWQQTKGRPCRIWDKNLLYHITTKNPLLYWSIVVCTITIVTSV